LNFVRPPAAFVEEEVVIHWDERTLAYDTLRSVRVPVAYDSFQDQKEFLGQHRPAPLGDGAITLESSRYMSISVAENNGYRCCSGRGFISVLRRVRLAKGMMSLRNFLNPSCGQTDPLHRGCDVIGGHNRHSSQPSP
jgi:hypothetical protein